MFKGQPRRAKKRASLSHPSKKKRDAFSARSSGAPTTKPRRRYRCDAQRSRAHTRDDGVLTAGLLASTITDVDGSSDYYRGGYVSYATAFKIQLGVSAQLVEQHGVISTEVACEMARVARENLSADYGVGVTGIVGSEPVEGKPPGTIHIAVHPPEADTGCQPLSYAINLGRTANKRRAVTSALFLLRRTLLANAN